MLEIEKTGHKRSKQEVGRVVLRQNGISDKVRASAVLLNVDLCSARSIPAWTSKC